MDYGSARPQPYEPARLACFDHHVPQCRRAQAGSAYWRPLLWPLGHADNMGAGGGLCGARGRRQCVRSAPMRPYPREINARSHSFRAIRKYGAYPLFLIRNGLAAVNPRSLNSRQRSIAHSRVAGNIARYDSTKWTIRCVIMMNYNYTIRCKQPSGGQVRRVLWRGGGDGGAARLRQGAIAHPLAKLNYNCLQ